ncbi:DNA-processing protein DprA [Neoaquamicrobium sediminum]|uniref:DNA-processing protein DprA n=1 Tax=Neoaquamicrobium sediminum TaxID=1849104 RepID=A0ABV3WUV6_9HYPH
MNELLEFTSRTKNIEQKSLFREQTDADLDVFYAGDLSLLKRRCVSVIGARDVSEQGAGRARKIARSLADAGVVVVSGLAKGVDIEAHRATLEVGGDTVAVIGTPLGKCYPIDHASIQEEIWSQHLLISQFKAGTRTFPSDFPKRNRLMAALTDASVIVEASDSSGTLHQAAECVKLGRWLFIMKSVAENPDLEWPAKFLGYEKCAKLEDVAQILEAVAH